MYDDILFPTDGSDASKATFPHAVRQARAFDARIHVLYVVDTTAAGVGADGGESVDSLRAEGKRVLTEFEERLLGEDVEVVPEMADGDPFAQIKRYGDDGTDMIVMGTRGPGGTEKRLLGGVLEDVVRTAEVPVFTVRTPE